MFRKKLALIGVVTLVALSGCATYDQYGYGGQQGRGDYYYGRPQVSSSVGVSIGSGYGYGYPGYYGSYGYPGYYGSRYGYGYPYGPYRPPVKRPRPDQGHGNGNNNGHVDRGNPQRPGWRDLDGIKNRNRNEPRPTIQPIQQVQRDIPRVRDQPSSNRGSFGGTIERARRANREKTIEP